MYVTWYVLTHEFKYFELYSPPFVCIEQNGAFLCVGRTLICQEFIVKLSIILYEKRRCKVE